MRRQAAWCKSVRALVAGGAAGPPVYSAPRRSGSVGGTGIRTGFRSGSGPRRSGFAAWSGCAGPGTVSVGDSVHDSATLTGATADAGGTVTYTVYSDNACTQNPVDAGTKTVTNGNVPDSNDVTFSTAGTFFWQSVYSGDANNNGATSDCTSEKLVVKTKPQIATTLSANPVNVGDSVHDSATLTGATADAGGTVTYTVYSDNTCTQNPVDAGTKTVTNGNVPDSNGVT